MYMTVQNVKCKDMNNLRHILNILFFFHSSVYNITHMHTFNILNLLSVHLLSHESLIKKKRNEIIYTDDDENEIEK